MEVTGIISKVLPEESGVGKQSGKPWKTQTFVIKNNDGYQGQEQIYAFSIFGDEKIDKFNQYNKVGDNVKVSFNIDTKLDPSSLNAIPSSVPPSSIIF